MTVTKQHYVERLMGRIAFTAAFCCFTLHLVISLQTRQLRAGGVEIQLSGLLK
jgi:hypothetical protein